jgi:AraC-like DNA-binding protein
MAEMEGRRGMARLVGLLEVLDLLSRSREAQPLSSPSFVPSLREGERERIDRVCRFLNDRYTERIPLGEAAERAHMSVPAFSRFFRRKTGRTFVAYLNELRTGHACRLLIETDKTVSEVCFASGFNNLSNFNRRFLTLKGMSPRAWRHEFADAEVGR